MKDVTSGSKSPQQVILHSWRSGIAVFVFSSFLSLYTWDAFSLRQLNSRVTKNYQNYCQPHGQGAGKTGPSVLFPLEVTAMVTRLALQWKEESSNKGCWKLFLSSEKNNPPLSFMRESEDAVTICICHIWRLNLLKANLNTGWTCFNWTLGRREKEKDTDWYIPAKDKVCISVRYNLRIYLNDSHE